MRAVRVALWCAASILSAARAMATVPTLGTSINMGNVLEAPLEGEWAPPAQEYYFDDYKAAGFKTVRIPVRWDNHTLEVAPYTVNATWMARVQQVVGWATSRNLQAIINSHHDDWLDDPNAFPSKLPRFQAIWQQVAAAFEGYSPLLMFEMYNEPHLMTPAQLNTMVQTFYQTVRPLHPTRVLLMGGLQWNSPWWIVQNPSAMQFPNDPNIILEIHDYDPFTFTTPPISITDWGTTANVSAVYGIMDNITAWSQAHNNIPVLLGEFGCSVQQPNHTARIAWYTAFTAAVKAQGSTFVGYAIWDDDGWFETYDRAARTWDEDVLAAIGL